MIYVWSYLELSIRFHKWILHLYLIYWGSFRLSNFTLWCIEMVQLVLNSESTLTKNESQCGRVAHCGASVSCRRLIAPLKITQMNKRKHNRRAHIVLHVNTAYMSVVFLIKQYCCTVIRLINCYYYCPTIDIINNFRNIYNII